jgi:heterodisulfide reductase subunit C
MQLIAISNYIKFHQEASVTELCRAFNISPKHLRAFLDRLLRKGTIEIVSSTSKCHSGCGTCSTSSCPLEDFEIYSWKN